MLNSIENLINALPEPIRNVIKLYITMCREFYGAGYEDGYKDSEEGQSCPLRNDEEDAVYGAGHEKEVYLALFDLKRWLDEPTYGESILKEMSKDWFALEKYKIVMKHLDTYHEIMKNLEKWRVERTPLKTYKLPNYDKAEDHVL